MLLFTSFAVVAFAVIASSIEAADVNHNHDEFKVHNNVLELTNLHRKSGVLRFSVQGVNVSKVTLVGETWNVELADKTVMHLRRFKSFLSNVTEYEFTWPKAGPSVDREICFHYGFNGANW